MALHATRRRLLGGLAAGTLAGTAGCLRQAQERLTSVDAPDSGPPTYRQWLPAPAALPGERDGYGVHYLRLSDVRGDPTTRRAGIGLRNLHARTGRDPLGIGAERIEEVVKVGLVEATILVGEFDVDSVVEAAATIGYEPAGTDGDYTIHERSDRDRAIAVSGDAVIHSHDREDPRSVLGAVLDARRGEIDRYHEVDTNFAELSSAAGAPSFLWMLADSGIDAIEDVSATVSTMQFDDERAVLVVHYLFEDADSVSTEAVRTQIARSNLPRTAPFDVEVDGRTVTAEYVRSLEDLAGDGYELRPIVDWNFEYDRDRGDLDVVHHVGDAVDAEALTVEASTASEPFDTQFADRYDTVEPGDSITIPVDPETTVRIVWETENSTSLVGQYRVE